jgi:hypothetical protein
MKRVKEIGRTLHSVIDQFASKGDSVARKKLLADAYDRAPVLSMLDELQLCLSPHLIQTYVAQFTDEREITIIMEYMDCSCLDVILDKANRVPTHTIGRIVDSVKRI